MAIPLDKEFREIERLQQWRSTRKKKKSGNVQNIPRGAGKLVSAQSVYETASLLCVPTAPTCALAFAAPPPTTSSSSSSPSPFSFFSSKSGRFGSVRRVSNPLESEPSFRRSRSVGIPFLRSKFVLQREAVNLKPPASSNRSKLSFWSVFRTHKSTKGEEAEDEEVKKREAVPVTVPEPEPEPEPEEDYATRMMMMRSRSVSVPVASNFGVGDLRSSSVKGRGWHFPSPIKAFRQSKTSKVIQERPPLYKNGSTCHDLADDRTEPSKISIPIRS
ncbi:hypothetical protein F0562_012637 [Nyssa sinensis]|uniref:Uncharacterized protein n=1 Tax=Nyssa sinensis TaxID=561372 RepID=A0A5J4ZVJ4_9ASTE|nr:hypothetical protein F0562_012637 [Nyssa sinensis]